MKIDYTVLRILHMNAAEIWPRGRPRLDFSQVTGTNFLQTRNSDRLTIKLDIVDVPAGEGVRVGLEVTEDARVTGASEVAVVLVDAELEAQTVNLKWT